MRRDKISFDRAKEIWKRLDESGLKEGSGSKQLVNHVISSVKRTMRFAWLTHCADDEELYEKLKEHWNESLTLNIGTTVRAIRRLVNSPGFEVACIARGLKEIKKPEVEEDERS